MRETGGVIEPHLNAGVSLAFLVNDCTATSFSEYVIVSLNGKQ
jgi:hypothetical protein